MPDTESDHHRGDAAVARLDLVAPPAAPAATTTTSCATTTATARDDEEEEDGFTFAAVDLDVAVAIPRLQDDAHDSALFPDARIGGSPVYPVFGRPRRSLSLPKQQEQQEIEEEDSATGGTVATAPRVSLERLLLEEQWSHCAPSASGQQQQQPLDAADADDEAETYCLWSPARCRSSGSTGSSVLRWRRRRRRAVDGRGQYSDGNEFLGTSSDRVGAGGGQGWVNRGSPSRGGVESTTTTTFLRCKQDLVELVVSVVTCRRSCDLF